MKIVYYIVCGLIVICVLAGCSTVYVKKDLNKFGRCGSDCVRVNDVNGRYCICEE